MASVDWGVDVDSAAFRWPEPATAGSSGPAGGTRFLAFWDQRELATGPRPEPYGYGAVHEQEQINEALRHPRPYHQLGYHPAIADRAGRGAHGTHVLDIAAGNGRAGGPAGVAPDADLIFVHLADRTTGGLANLGDSVRLLEAIDFISRTAGSQPCVINISAGRTCGPKDGTTLVERALDELLTGTPGRFVVNSAGNYFGWRTHSCGVIAPGESRSLTFVIDPADITLNELEIWYDGADEFAVRIDPPGYAGGQAVCLGERSDLLIEGQPAGRVYHRKHDPNNGDNHFVAYIDPIGRAGDWTVTLEARQVRSGRFHAWVERDDTCRGCQARFVPGDSNPVTTIGTIASSRLPLIVGAYDGQDPARPVAPFSSSGPSRDLRPKPDLVAPGVEVLAARSASIGDSRNPGLLVRKSGTSMATPHVTGAVALCFEMAGSALTARQIRSLVLGSCDPARAHEMPFRLGSGYLNIPRLIADLERSLNAPAIKEPTMNTDDSIVMLAAAPANVYREYVYRPHSPLARWIDDRFDVVTRPGQRFDQAPRPGDVLLEVTLGRNGPGRCLVLEGSDPKRGLSRRLSAGQLLLRPRRRASMSEPLPVEPAVGIEGLGSVIDEFRDADDVGPPPWTDTPEQRDFRDRVLQAHLNMSQGAPQRDLSQDELEHVPGTDVLTARATAFAAGRLLAAANADLRAAQQAEDPDALRTVQLTVTSGYRSSDKQRELWLGYFSRKDGYYDRSRAARATCPGGPHSEQAVAYLLKPKRNGGFGLAGRIAAPGYSNHQGGIAVDYYQERVREHPVPNDSGDEARARWRATWFHKWLLTNAANYGFCPILTEEWHWEYRPASSLPAGSTFAGVTGDAPACEITRFAQRVLMVLGDGRVAETGTLDSGTRAALGRFRARNGLGVGGVLDARTDVALVQRALEHLAKASMFAQVGDWDTATDQALARFRAARGLSAGTALDAATRRALAGALAGETARDSADDTSETDHLGGKLWTFTATPLAIRTAVFCPRAGLGRGEVDVVVFAHGLLGGCPRPRQVPAGFVTDGPFGLARVIDATGRPTVLVVPSLDWENPGGETVFGPGRGRWHALALPRYLNALVTQALAEVGRIQSTTAPVLNELVITGHSRAYDFLEPLAHSRHDPAMQEGPLARLSLIGAFDTSYAGQVEPWIDWLKASPGLTVHLFYRSVASPTAAVGDAFYARRGKRLVVTRVSEKHCLVPATRLPSLLAATSAGATPDDAPGPAEDTPATFTPPVIPALSGNAVLSHTITWDGRSVEVHFFPGVSDQTVLILAGVHQDERKALALSAELLRQLQAAQDKPFNNVVFIPDLFGGRQTDHNEIDGIPTNRNCPGQNESLADAAKRGKGVPKDDVGRKVLPENLILFALVENVKPRASLSLHNHGPVTSPAEICTRGAASVTVDPRPGNEAVADYLAKEMALAASQANLRVPGNEVTGDSARTRYPTQLASHKDGVTFGQWGSGRGGMNQYLIETEGKLWPKSPDTVQQAEMASWTHVIWSTFLAAPRDVTAVAVQRALAREWQAVTGALNW